MLELEFLCDEFLRKHHHSSSTGEQLSRPALPPEPKKSR